MIETPSRPDLNTLSPLPPGHPPNRWLPILLGILVLLICYLSFKWAVGAVIHSRPVVMVPDLNGKSVADALNLLSQSRLGLTKEGEQFDKRFPAGTIVRQNPAAGMMVREGHLIKITLSQGGETLFVPDLHGQPFRNAQTSLQNAGLGVGEVDHRPSLRFEKDQIMATDPPAGAVVNKNALVNLILSEGPPGSGILLTPDFVGKTLSEVKQWGSEHQVPIAVKEESDISKASGEILMQAPVVDSPLRPGDTLTVVANTGVASGTGPHVHYEVPQGASDRDIRILVIDEAGEREVFRKAEAPGSRIEFPVTVKGRARARIMVNGILVEEQDLQ
jgi:beta-lactam-binding protein with PASTA domain